MPVCERDPWRLQFFEGIACPDGVNIPTDDPDAWEWYPEHRWVYDKLRIAALEAVLHLYEDPARLAERLPVLRYMTRKAEEIEIQAQRLLPAVTSVESACWRSER